jgi:hypothetical protein
MVQIVIVEKGGSLKELNVDNYDVEFLSKKAGFKNVKDFKEQTCWKLQGHNVYLYGKTEGRAGQENKYDMPPPVDNTLFFGACVLIMRKKNTEVDLPVKLWKKIYEKLFGGFEDIGEEDSEEEEEEDEDADLPQTKEGYAKDGFVVEDEEEEEEEEEEDDEEEEEEDADEEEEEDEDEVEEEDEPSPPKRVQPKRKAKKSSQNVFISLQNALEDEYLNCESELSEEEYV